MRPWSDKRVLLVGGPGGVGKTTLAAALGVRLASQGYKTVVLTVDPARRLAQALGLKGLHNDLQRVPMEGELHASMLDSQRYFDQVIERFAKSREQAERVIAHPLYRAATSSMGGTHEYAAMERLLEFTERAEFDRIVVDTPPTQNAVDLFSAPKRMADFMNASVLDWFRGDTKPRYLQWFQHGTKMAMKLMEKVFGSDFLTNFGSFMEDLHGMHEGFRKRNLQVMDLLRGPDSAFVLVTYPSEVRVRESETLWTTLQEERIELAAVLANRVEPTPPPIPTPCPPGAQRLLEFSHGVHGAQQEWVRALRGKMPNVPIQTILRRPHGPNDIESLSSIGGELIQ